jgi:hypothetical protein
VSCCVLQTCDVVCDGGDGDGEIVWPGCSVNKGSTLVRKERWLLRGANAHVNMRFALAELLFAVGGLLTFTVAIKYNCVSASIIFIVTRRPKYALSSRHIDQSQTFPRP